SGSTSRSASSAPSCWTASRRPRRTPTRWIGGWTERSSGGNVGPPRPGSKDLTRSRPGGRATGCRARATAPPQLTRPPRARRTLLRRAAYGLRMDVAGRSHSRGLSPDDDYWRFLAALVDAAAERWRAPDSGIWEVRGPRRHFVPSKASCWSALDRGLTLARECSRKAPERRWRLARKELRAAIESKGYDKQRGVFVRTFGSRDLDASALPLP